jgi:hypothetical protein
MVSRNYSTMPSLIPSLANHGQRRFAPNTGLLVALFTIHERVKICYVPGMRLLFLEAYPRRLRLRSNPKAVLG